MIFGKVKMALSIDTPDSGTTFTTYRVHQDAIMSYTRIPSSPDYDATFR